jgi:polyhydroxybutyrate depolymerase
MNGSTRRARGSALASALIGAAAALVACAGSDGEPGGAAGQVSSTGGLAGAGGAGGAGSTAVAGSGGAQGLAGGGAGGALVAGGSGGGSGSGGGGGSGGLSGSGSGGVGVNGGVSGSGGVSAGGGGSGNGGTSGAAAGDGNRAGGGSGGGAGSGNGGGAGTAPGAGCGVAAGVMTGRASISVGGTMREYILRIPEDYDTNRPYKLIFGFHARGGNATQVAGSGNDDYYGLYDRSAGSAIFVSPEGIDAGWRNTDDRDVDLVKALIARFDAALCIDHQRIFSVGFSFGGMMSDAVGCAMADVFRAIAPMAGAIQTPEHLYSECNQPNMDPIAVWMAHGTSDTVVPIEDGKVALELFLARAGCDAGTMPVAPSPCVAYEGCLPGHPIHFCEWNGGHGVPSFAADAIWDFFDQF